MKKLLMSVVTLGTAVLLIVAGVRRTSLAKDKKRPNFIFILTDDQRWDQIGCMGKFPWLKTPNIDRIAQEGALFANSFVTISLCSPSRGCFLTGVYPHIHEVRLNEDKDIDPGIPNMGQLFQKEGYETAYVGKWHMKPISDPRPGFDYWLSFKGQGVYNNPPLNENGKEFNAEGYMTDLLNDYAINWLKKPRNKPFLLYLSHKAIHGPSTPAERHKDLYKDAEMPEPPNFRDTFKGKPEWQRAGFVRGGRREDWLKNKDKKIPESLDPGVWNSKMTGGRLGMFQTIAAVDEGIGKIFKTLEEMGELDNTVIIFAGDNGYFYGEHRRGDKRLAYEESIRVPLLVRYPAIIKPGTKINEMVLNIDLLPSMLNISGAKIPPHVQGKSFKPLLEGKTVSWRKSFLYEYFQEDWLPSIPTMLGVRTEEWKYIIYPEIKKNPELFNLKDMDELYDLKNDPYEMKNLAEDSAYKNKLTELQKELAKLMKETNYKEPPEPEKVEMKAELVLHYSFDDKDESSAKDESGNGNDGTIIAGSNAAGILGSALTFDGNSVIKVANSDSLNPAEKPWSVEAIVNSSAEDGVVFARGGESYGYALYFEKGLVKFSVRSKGANYTICSSQKISGQWAHIAGVITGDHKLKLYVNGGLEASDKIQSFIAANPNEAMEIGADEGSPAGDYGKNAVKFKGIIDDVKIYKGELSESEIKKNAEQAIKKVGLPKPEEKKLETKTSAVEKKEPVKPSAVKSPAKTIGENVLYYSFDDGNASDNSGKNNNGVIEGAVAVDGKTGKALQFDGKSQVKVANSESLNPQGKTLTAEAWIKAEKGDGAILARGGHTHGYALVIKDGKPQFIIRVSREINSVSAKEDVVGRWVHISGVLTEDKKLEIYVDGKLSGSAEASDFVVTNPSEAMEIGNDGTTPVGDYKTPFNFTGIIDEVKIYAGK